MKNVTPCRRRLAKRGYVPCKECDKPHNAYWVQKGLAPQWTAKDGHPYQPIVADPNAFIERLVRRGVVTVAQLTEAVAK